MNIEIVVGKERLPGDMHEAWFADQVATALRGEDGHNVTVLIGTGKGVPSVTHEGKAAANDEERALAMRAQEVVADVLTRSDYPHTVA